MEVEGVVVSCAEKVWTVIKDPIQQDARRLLMIAAGYTAGIKGWRAAPSSGEEAGEMTASQPPTFYYWKTWRWGRSTG